MARRARTQPTCPASRCRRRSTVTADLIAAARADVLIVATPVSALTAIARSLAECGADAPLVWLSKGFVDAPMLPAGVGLPHQRIAPLWRAPVGVVSGPSFAEEVANGLPTALAVAATDAVASRAQMAACFAATRCARTRATTSRASRPAGRSRTFSRSRPARATGWDSGTTRARRWSRAGSRKRHG